MWRFFPYSPTPKFEVKIRVLAYLITAMLVFCAWKMRILFYRVAPLGGGYQGASSDHLSLWGFPIEFYIVQVMIFLFIAMWYAAEVAPRLSGRIGYATSTCRAVGVPFGFMAFLLFALFTRQFIAVAY